MEPRMHTDGQEFRGFSWLLASLLLCFLAPFSCFAQATQNVAHQQFLGLVADPGNVVKGSAFYRSDLDTLRLRVGAVEFWDGSSYVPIPGAGHGIFKKLNYIRLVEPTLWPGGTVTADIDAAISDCASSVCLVVYPSNLGAGEATTIPQNATIFDLRQTAFPVSGNATRISGLLVRRRMTTTPPLAFDSLQNLHLYTDASDGGAYNSTSKVTYNPLRLDLDGRTQGQHILVGGQVFNYGIGDALFLGGSVWGYGAKNVTGTSQPTAEFAEINVKQGATVFTAIVSGDPASGATTINYASDTNESVLGERALINTSRTTIAGTVTGIAADIVTFSGAPDWTTLSPSAVGQYFKINADDVTLGGVSTGYWYRVIAVTSATQLQLENNYDSDLTTSGAYTLAQGAEITAFNTSTNQLTIEANSYDWAALDNLISPPMPLLHFRGLNLILTKQFKSGTSRAINISNTGPFHWEQGILIEGAPAGDNAFLDAIDIIAKVDDAIDMSTAAIAGAALKIPNDKVIRWGTDSDFKFSTAGSFFLFNKGGRFETASASVKPLTVKHAASPTVNFFDVQDSNGAAVFEITSAKIANLNTAFGSGIRFDPIGAGGLPTISAAGTNAGIHLNLDSKTTGAVRINSTNSSGTGGLEVYDGAATPSRVFSVTSTGVRPNDRGFKHARVSTGSVGAGASAAVTLNWTTAFADANYTVNCSVQEATASTSTIRLHHLESVAAGSVVARVVNDDGAAAHTGTLHCTAIHD